MRRKQCQVTDPDRICRVLEECRIGRLATFGLDGYPYITPVNFVWHKAAVYFHSAPEGEKLENLRRNPKVCFEVDLPLSYLDLHSTTNNPCRVHQLYHCVIIRGRAEIVEEGGKKVEALNALVRSHEGKTPFEPINAGHPAVAKCCVVRVQPEQISAKSDLLQGKKEEVVQGICEYLKGRGEELDKRTIEAIEVARVKEAL